jgi:hypothetical protein
MNILSAHQSSSPICPATESVSAVGFPRSKWTFTRRDLHDMLAKLNAKSDRLVA